MAHVNTEQPIPTVVRCWMQKNKAMAGVSSFVFVISAPTLLVDGQNARRTL